MKTPLVQIDSGNSQPSEQAETSSSNPQAANVHMRILIELQVISILLHTESRVTEDLSQIRNSVAKTIT